jgi:hypothetical protein
MISIKNKIIPDVSERCWYPHGKVSPTIIETIYIELSNKKIARKYMIIHMQKTIRIRILPSKILSQR